MKKKLVSIVLTALMVASLTTACGGKKETSAPAPAPETKTETKAETPAPEPKAETPETKAETEEPAPEAESADDSSASDEFTLLDVSSDMIQVGVYAVSEDGTELVFSMFTDPSGTPMASLFVFLADGTGDVICGPYTGETETDEDGINWTALTVSDVYTGSDFTFGSGELGDQVFLLDSEDAYEGQYLTADETIDYMAAAVALME